MHGQGSGQRTVELLRTSNSTRCDAQHEYLSRCGQPSKQPSQLIIRTKFCQGTQQRLCIPFILVLMLATLIEHRDYVYETWMRTRPGYEQDIH